MEKTLYKEFGEFMELFDKYIQEHPEVNLHAYPWGEDAEIRQTFILR